MQIIGATIIIGIPIFILCWVVGKFILAKSDGIVPIIPYDIWLRVDGTTNEVLVTEITDGVVYFYQIDSDIVESASVEEFRLKYELSPYQD
jgi:hypothetical protein